MGKTNREILNIIYRFDIDISIIEFNYYDDKWLVWLGDYYVKPNKLRIGNNGYIDLINEYLESVGLQVKE